MTAPNADEFAPILDGPGESDYERYLRTDELLALQKTAGEWVHRDELLFQTVHQSSELWLKHAWTEVEEATRLIEARDLAGALRLLGRANRAMRHVIAFLEHLKLNEMDELIGALDKRPFHKDELIIKQGSMGETFYILASGRLLETILDQVQDRQSGELRSA